MTDLESLFTIRLMRIADIEKALTQQIKLDKKHLAQNFAEQNDLLPSVMRFRDLQKTQRRVSGVFGASLQHWGKISSRLFPNR